MITDRDDKWRVVTPPKTGATTLHHILSQPPIGGVLSNEGATFHDMRQHDGTMIASVRNPLDRALSLWRHRRHEIGREENGPPAPEDEYPFEAFLAELPDLTKFYSMTQSDFLRGLRIDALIRMERFEQDVRRLFPSVGNIPHMNSSHGAAMKHSPYTDPRNERAVRGWFAEDFDRWGY